MAISSALGMANAVPVGVVNPFAGATAPSGWLLCYGQAISRTQYPVLFTTLSTTYGSGDGSTTFNIPDMRGRAVAGKDDMGGTAASRLTSTVLTASNTLGATGGTETHTLTDAQLPATEIRVNDGSGTYPLFGGAGSTQSGYLGRPGTEFPNASNTGNAARAMKINGSGNAHLNTQPTIVLNYIIKAL